MTNNIIKEVREVFYLYRRNKLMIENYDYINKKGDKITIKELEEYNKYISFIDKILKQLDKEDRWILKNIFIDNKEQSEKVNQIELASNFQYWAITYLISKIEHYSRETKSKIISIGGGVSANKYFRNKISTSNNIYIFPEKKYSCDNAAMIAFLSFLQKNY